MAVYPLAVLTNGLLGGTGVGGYTSAVLAGLSVDVELPELTVAALDMGAAPIAVDLEEAEQEAQLSVFDTGVSPGPGPGEIQTEVD